MRKLFFTAFLGVVVLLLSGCPSLRATTTTNVFQDETVFSDVKVESIAPFITSGNYVQRANNLFVIFDASSSATVDYQNEDNVFKANNDPTRLEIQREILHRMNRTVAISAAALNMNNFKTGIRSFGYGDCKGYGPRYTDLHQAPTPYDKAAFDAAVETIRCAHGRSHISEALNAISNELLATTGNISLVIVSDLITNKINDHLDPITQLVNGLDQTLGDDGHAAIMALRQRFGDRLCVFNVWTGDENEIIEGLDHGYLAQNPANCGQPNYVTAGRAGDVDGMKDFMRAVLLSPVPKPASIDCATLDSDGDGVNDCDDKCPNTVKGTPVNKFGCWIVNVLFDNDKYNIRPEYFPLLDQLARDIEARYSHLKIEVQGHTSNTASAAHNMRLSINRANAVTNYLDKRIKGTHNLTPRGYGLTRPIFTNETYEGRAKNRRVQMEILR